MEKSTFQAKVGLAEMLKGGVILDVVNAEQARIAALLVERVDIGTGSLNVRLRVDGLSGLAREMLAGGIGEAA